jgi:hypothetical protein
VVHPVVRVNDAVVYYQGPGRDLRGHVQRVYNSAHGVALLEILELCTDLTHSDVPYFDVQVIW